MPADSTAGRCAPPDHVWRFPHRSCGACRGLGTGVRRGRQRSSASGTRPRSSRARWLTILSSGFPSARSLRTPRGVLRYVRHAASGARTRRSPRVPWSVATARASNRTARSPSSGHYQCSGKVSAYHADASSSIPATQRPRRWSWSCSTSCRSRRIVKRRCSSGALSNGSGGIEGREVWQRSPRAMDTSGRDHRAARSLSNSRPPLTRAPC